MQRLEHEQRDVCARYGIPFFFCDLKLKLGYAIETESQVPINGLRHSPKGDTSGWYIWFGEEFSVAADFFSPLHGSHLQRRCPEVLKLLGLPPGYRFLKAGDYVDVWFDSKLLDV